MYTFIIVLKKRFGRILMRIDIESNDYAYEEISQMVKVFLKKQGFSGLV
jgi:hypothetical protein